MSTARWPVASRPIEQKKRRRIAKALRRRPLPARFDLVQWLIDHDHATTRRQAREIILAKRVRANSHILGVETRQVATPGLLGSVKVEEKETVAPFVDTALRPDLVVLSA